MVAVPNSSIKYVTEHDILRFIGTLASTLLVPLIIWLFVSLSSQLSTLGDHIHRLDVQVAVLQSEVKKHRETAAAEFDAAKSQIRTTSALVQGLKEDANSLIKVINTKAAKGKN